MMTTHERHGSERARTWERIFAAGFIGCALIVAGLVLADMTDDRSLRARLLDGIAAAEENRWPEAEAAFRAVALSEDTALASLAYHNLGVMALLAADSASGEARRERIVEGLGNAEASLTLSPGRSATSQNLELALRWLESRGPPGQGADHGEEQSDPGDADTSSDEVASGSTTSPTGNRETQALSRARAMRLLASFRQVEAAGARSLIERLLEPRAGDVAVSRKGPPW